MVATAGYQAGVEANQVVVSYAQEATWGTAPAVPFQSVRLTAESLASTKKRDRPAEFNVSGEVSAAVTSQVSAGGDLTFALSFGTFDDLMAGALDSDWTAKTIAAGAAGDISVTAPVSGNFTVTTTTGGKFAGAAAAAGTGLFWVRLSGFVIPGNNGVFRGVSATSSSITLIAPAAPALQPQAETPAGSTVAVTTASRVTNAASFRSFYVQKQLSSSLFLTYPGSYVGTMNLSGGVGKFLNGSFTLLSQSELSGTTNLSTGAVLAAPTGLVHDSVGGFGGVFLNGALISSVVDSFSLKIESTGAALEYGMGSAAAQGVIAGLAEATGMVKVYFKDFSLYTLFKNETAGVLEFLTKDAAGNAYIISILSCKLMNPKVTASGQNQAVMVSFDLEGNPTPGGTGTVSIFRV